MKSEFQFEQANKCSSVLHLSQPSSPGDRSSTFALENQYLYKQKALLETKAEEALAEKQRFQALYHEILRKNDQIVQKAVNIQSAPLRQQLSSLNKQLLHSQKQLQQTLFQYSNEKAQLQRVFKTKLDQLLSQNQELQSKLFRQQKQNQELRQHFQSLNNSFKHQAIQFQQTIDKLEQAFQIKLQKHLEANKKAQQAHQQQLQHLQIKLQKQVDSAKNCQQAHAQQLQLKSMKQKQFQKLLLESQQIHKAQLRRLQKELKDSNDLVKRYQVDKETLNQKIINLEKLNSHRQNQLIFVKQELSRSCFRLLAYKLSNASLLSMQQTASQELRSKEEQLKCIQKRVQGQEQRQRRSRQQVQLVKAEFKRALDQTRRQLGL